MIPFVRSDTWVFMSVALGGGGKGATLIDVYAAGDRINHAVFRPDELRRGFAKLVAAGYVREEAGRFFLTDEGHALFERVGGVERTSLLAAWETLDALLHVSRTAADPSAFDDERWAYPGITAQRAREAAAEYRRQFKAAYQRRLGKG